MSKVDQFESAFRSAVKSVFTWAPPRLAQILIVTDLGADEAEAYGARVRSFLSVLEPDAPTWEVAPGDRFHTEGDLVELVKSHRPDLVCTYRHLHSTGWRWPYTMGDHVEVLTQATDLPVLVTPHPRDDDVPAHVLENTNSVTAMTDHLTGDDRLVNFAAALTEPDGTLDLVHVEDERTFDRYLDVIGKIPDIDTDVAREDIARRLLKEPTDFIESCREGLRAARPRITVEPTVTMGHHLAEYRRLVDERETDLLVINAKDEDQHAMHGLAYPLAVELRTTPLLML